MTDYQKQLNASREEWDKEAPQFDNEADHGLNHPDVHQAWKALLQEIIIPSADTILDIGCGTGSLSLLLAELGYQVTGADLSPKMLDIAREKTKSAGYDIAYHQMDVAYPEFDAESFDVIVCRHVLWALPEPENVLERWQKLLKPRGQLVLIEGFWHTGAGLYADDIMAMLPPNMHSTMQDLSKNPQYWGKEVQDERYLISAITE